MTREKFGLAPEGQGGRHAEVADELVASVDGQEFHGLLHEQCACELNGGDETQPDVGADQQTIFEIVSVHVIEEQREDKGGNQAGDEGDKIGKKKLWTCSYAAKKGPLPFEAQGKQRAATYYRKPASR